MLSTFLSFLLTVTPLLAVADQTQVIQKSAHRQVAADELKSWYDQKKEMVVLDARSKPYFDGTLLPLAKWVPVDSSEETIKSTIPSKDSLVVVYCAGVKCPASGWLYDKLTAMGYTNVYEYHGGLDDWMSKGFPTVKQ